MSARAATNDERLSAYAGLHDSSLAIALAPATSRAPHVNLVLPSVAPDEIFAGVKTAVQAAIVLGRRLGLPLRFIAMHESGSEGSYAETHTYLTSTFDIAPDRLTLLSRAGLFAEGFGVDDYWIATYWTTAHALDVAQKGGSVDPARVVYLVQDYEPGFFPWSSESSIASSTYHAPFTIVVNSLPLRNYLASTEGVHIADDLVFAPHFDVASMRRVAAARDELAPRDTPRIFFYGRPGKPRNLYTVGLTALRLAVTALHADGVAVEVVSAGLPHADIDLGHGTTMSSLGRLDWEEYCDLLAGVDVGLSLQKSAHPSHPPLEIAMSGAWAVTNEFAGTREDLHPRQVVRHDDPESLADGVVEAVRRSSGPEARTFLEPDLQLLGRDFDDVLGRVAALLPQ
ncbi:MAG: hypothetical protein ABW004_04645 [Aeromicrobium sp.]